MNKQTLLPLPSQTKTEQKDVSVNKTSNLNTMMSGEKTQNISPAQQIFSSKTINAGDFLPKPDTTKATIAKPFSNVMIPSPVSPNLKSATQNATQESPRFVQNSKINPAQSSVENITNNKKIEENYYSIENKPTKSMVGNPLMSDKTSAENIKNKTGNLYSATMTAIQKTEAQNAQNAKKPPDMTPAVSMSPSSPPSGGSNQPIVVGGRGGKHTTIDEAMISSSMLPLWRQRFNG